MSLIAPIRKAIVAGVMAAVIGWTARQGWTLDTEPVTMPHGVRVIRLRDPDGFRRLVDAFHRHADHARQHHGLEGRLQVHPLQRIQEHPGTGDREHRGFRGVP